MEGFINQASGLGVYQGYIGMMEKNMEATIPGLGFRVSQKQGHHFKGPYRKDYSISM